MSDYSRQNDFSAKDSLATGDANKLIKGSEVDAEFDALVTAVATKYDSADLASQAVAEAGASNATLMTPLRTEQWKTNWITEDITFSGANTFTDNLTVSSAFPAIRWNETDAGADEKVWEILVNGDQKTYQLRDDAISAASPYMTVFRTGTTVNEIQLDATTLDFNGDVRVSGALYAGDAAGDSNPLRLVANDSIGDNYLSFLENDATTRKGLIGYQGTSDNNLVIENEESATLELWTNSGSLVFSGNSGSTHHLELSSAGAVTTPNSSASEVGYKGSPEIRAISASSNTAASDMGGTVRFSGGSGQTFTLDGDMPAYGTVLLLNTSGNDWTITSAGTLNWALNADTGARTLATEGMAVAYHRGSNVWQIAGAGLS